MPSSLQLAVLRTVLYGDVFSFALTDAEIHRYLISGSPATLDDVRTALAALCDADGPLCTEDGTYCLADRPELHALRRERERVSEGLMPPAERFGVWLARLPFIRLVALTGALAMHNAAGPDDDLDYLLVTTPGRVWLARAFSIVLVRLARMRGYIICPNYVLSETALAQERADLFIAHELAQMRPLYGVDVYRRMLDANPWMARYLANATEAIDAARMYQPGRLMALAKQASEWLLGGRPGDWLESWERRRKLRRFAVEMATPHHDARLDDDHVKGHFNDHGHRVLAAYYERLRAYDCAEEAAAAD
jgi:hypothetical protein